jgi:hypothetical protein
MCFYTLPVYYLTWLLIVLPFYTPTLNPFIFSFCTPCKMNTELDNYASNCSVWYASGRRCLIPMQAVLVWSILVYISWYVSGQWSTYTPLFCLDLDVLAVYCDCFRIVAGPCYVTKKLIFLGSTCLTIAASVLLFTWMVVLPWFSRYMLAFRNSLFLDYYICLTTKMIYFGLGMFENLICLGRTSLSTMFIYRKNYSD